MKAAIYKTYGSPQQILVDNIELPPIKEDEILIKVKATTVNRSDCGILRGNPFIIRLLIGLCKPKKETLGTDFAGVVEKIGSKYPQFNVGDRVFGFNDMGIKSQAEYMIVSTKEALSKIPDTISFPQAAASIEGFHYAYNFVNKVNISKGDKILVNGSSGAIGSALMQILIYLEADITVVCDEKNIDTMKEYGIKNIIDYTKEDFTAMDKKFDFVFDAVGKNSFGKCKNILKDKGVYISSELGAYGENIFYTLFTKFFSKKKVLFPFPINIQASLTFVTELLQKKMFRPLIDRTYQLENIVEAYTYVETGKKSGNVILEINNQ